MQESHAAKKTIRHSNEKTLANGGGMVLITNGMTLML